MFFSKACLKSTSDGGTGALASFLAGASVSIGQGHHLVWSLFGDRAGDRQFLYRMTGATMSSPILIASEEEPRDAHSLWDIEIKELRLLDTLANGDTLEWSLRVNATVKSKMDTGKAKSSRHCIIDRAMREGAKGTSRQLAEKLVPEWLAPRMRKDHGIDCPIDQMLVRAYEKRRFGHGPRGRGQPVVVAMTDVIGVGKVMDADKARSAIREGIGGARGYGCGLLLVRRVR